MNEAEDTTEVRDVQNMDHLPEEASGSEHRQPKKETLGYTIEKTAGQSCPSSLNVITIANVGHRAMRLRVLPGFDLAFFPIPLSRLISYTYFIYLFEISI